MTGRNVYNSVKWKGAGMILVAEKIHLHLKHECASRTRVRKLPSTAHSQRVPGAPPLMYSASTLFGHRPRCWAAERTSLGLSEP